MSDTYEKSIRIDHLIRKEQHKRDELMLQESRIGFYNRKSRRLAMYNSITKELEIRSQKSHLHKKSTGRHLSKRDRHSLMDQDKKRLELQHSSHELNKFYALVEIYFIVEDIQDLRIERSKWMLAGTYDNQDERGLSRVFETILEEMNALNRMQILEKKSRYPGDGTGDLTLKTLHELLKETLRECVSDLAEQDGWTMAKAQEAYGYVKQALVGGVGVDRQTTSRDERIMQDVDKVDNVSDKSNSEDQALDMKTDPVMTSHRMASAVVKWLLPVIGLVLGCVIYWI